MLTAFTTNRWVCAFLRCPTPPLSSLSRHHYIITTPAARSHYNTFQKSGGLLIVAKDVESDALTMLSLNKHQAGLNENVSTFKFGPSTTRSILPSIAKPSSVFIQKRNYSPSRFMAALGVVIIPENTSVIIKRVVIIPENNNSIIMERFKTRNRIIAKPGLHFIIPLFERVAFSQYMGHQYLIVPHKAITMDGFNVCMETTLELKTVDVILAYHNQDHIFAAKNKVIKAMNDTISKVTVEKIVSDRPQIELDIKVQLTPALQALGIDCINCHTDFVDYAHTKVDTNANFMKLWQVLGQAFIQALVIVSAIVSAISLVRWVSINTGKNVGIEPNPNKSRPNGKGASLNDKGA